MSRGLFVFCVCGDAHVERVNTAVKFLKRMTRNDILVVCARGNASVLHDQVLRVPTPADLSDHQSSIYLKTSLPLLLGGEGPCCYLDSDQIATSAAVDEIFDLFMPPITFANDNGSVDQFSRYAVRCGCTEACDCLRRAIRQSYGVAIDDGTWRHWNGGMYLFDRSTREFSQSWHDNTLLAFEHPYWYVRDQGTLIATAWQHDLQHHPVLPQTATRIVDKYFGFAEAQRSVLTEERFHVDRSYALGAPDAPAFLHFINGGVNTTGWLNWDEVAHAAG
jgi:hypothetical protein